jgi:hypothetical protein
MHEAAHLGGNPKTLRLAAERGETDAIHSRVDGPWIFSRADLEGSAAKEIGVRAGHSTKDPAGPHLDQQTLFPSMT